MKPKFRSFLLFAGISLLATSISHAADVTWDITPGTVGAGDSAVTGGTGAWNTSLAAVPNGNWTTDAGVNNIAWVNANNDTAVFGGTAGTVTLGEAISVGGVKINTASYVISGNTLTLASGTNLESSVGNSTTNTPRIDSALAGSAGFTKTGTGWLQLNDSSNIDTLSGNINIQAGTLYARHEALGTGGIVFTGNSTFIKVYNANANFPSTMGVAVDPGVSATINGATFYYNANFAGVLAGGTTSALTVSIGGNVEFQFNNTSNTFEGQLTMSGGGTADNGGRAVFKSLPDSTQKIRISDSVFRLANGGVAMNFANRPIEILNNSRIDNDSTNTSVVMTIAQNLTATIGNNARTLTLSGVNTGDNTYGGVISNSATGTGKVSVTKSEAGKWILAGNNTYTGATTVSAGTLVLADNAQLKFVLGATSGNNNALTGAGTLTLNGDFVIDTSAADALASGSWTLENVGTLTGGAYGSGFQVFQTDGTTPWTDAGSDKWTKDIGGKIYTFDETTGILTLATTGGGSTYDTWAASKGLTGASGSATDPAKDADPDKDGSNNLSEFAFNGDPLSGSDNGKVYVLTEDSDFAGDPSSAKELILTIAVRTGTPVFAGSPSPSATQATDGITYRIEGSLDLAGFPTTVNVVPTPVIIGLPVDPGTGYVYRSFSLDGSDGLSGKGFLRAKVTSP